MQVQPHSALSTTRRSPLHTKMAALEPVFARLSDEALLERRADGKTRE